MFDHSIKVPRLYKTAAKLYKDLQDNKGSIKQLVYQAKHQNIKALYALVVETHKRRNEIDSLFKSSKLFAKEPRLDPILARILLTELLWGKQRLAGESKPVKTVLAYEQIFKEHLSDVAHNNSNEKISEVQKPRYVRVNTLMLSTNETVNGFRNEDWNFVRFNDKQDYKGFLESVKCLGEYDFMVDIHIPDLLVFHPKTQFYNHSAYLEGQIILQDKASCLPAFILNPEPGSRVLDMCAAPGMKTTHLAALMKNEGTIYAVEFDLRRAAVLENMLESTGVTCAKTINRDVLTVTDEQCPNIEYILVDPSCSGTGIIDRLNIEEHASKNKENRITKLAGFQAKILRHALTKFPSAKRVVYSTCSLNAEENEDVVRQVLETCTTFKLIPAKKFMNNIWLNFGSSDFGKMGSYCLYTRPETDLTNGFFIAVFERLQDGEENEFLNKQVLKKFKKHNKHKISDGQNLAYDESATHFDDDEEVFENNPDSQSNKKKKHKKNKVYPSINDQQEDAFSQNESEHNESVAHCDPEGHNESNADSHSNKKKKHKRNKVYPSVADQQDQFCENVIKHDESATHLDDNEGHSESNPDSHSNKKKKRKKNKAHSSKNDQHEAGLSQEDSEHLAYNESATNFGDLGAVEENHHSHLQRKKKHKKSQEYTSIDDACEQEFSQNNGTHDGGSKNKKKSKRKQELSRNQKTTINENNYDDNTKECRSHSNTKKKRKLEDETAHDGSLDNRAKKIKIEHLKTNETEALDNSESTANSVNTAREKKKKKFIKTCHIML